MTGETIGPNVYEQLGYQVLGSLKIGETPLDAGQYVGWNGRVYSVADSKPTGVFAWREGTTIGRQGPSSTLIPARTEVTRLTPIVRPVSS